MRFGMLETLMTFMKWYGTKPSSIQRRTYALCKCDCGEKTEVRLVDLKSGHTTSCGCKKRRMNEWISRLEGKDQPHPAT